MNEEYKECINCGGMYGTSYDFLFKGEKVTVYLCGDCSWNIKDNLLDRFIKEAGQKGMSIKQAIKLAGRRY